MAKDSLDIYDFEGDEKKLTPHQRWLKQREHKKAYSSRAVGPTVSRQEQQRLSKKERDARIRAEKLAALLPGGLCPVCKRKVIVKKEVPLVRDAADGGKYKCRKCQKASSLAQKAGGTMIVPDPDNPTTGAMMPKPEMGMHIQSNGLRDDRRRIGLSQAQFAEACGWSGSKQAKIEMELFPFLLRDDWEKMKEVFEAHGIVYPRYDVT